MKAQAQLTVGCWICNIYTQLFSRTRTCSHTYSRSHKKPPGRSTRCRGSTARTTSRLPAHVPPPGSSAGAQARRWLRSAKRPGEAPRREGEGEQCTFIVGGKRGNSEDKIEPVRRWYEHSRLACRSAKHVEMAHLPRVGGRLTSRWRGAPAQRRAGGVVTRGQARDGAQQVYGGVRRSAAAMPTHCAHAPAAVTTPGDGAAQRRRPRPRTRAIPVQKIAHACATAAAPARARAGAGRKGRR